MKKRLFTILLAALMLSTACGQSAAEETAADTSAADTAADNAEAETALQDHLPEKDLAGYNYRMMVHGTDVHKADTYIEELSGNLISDAVFNKIAAVEDRFNVDVTLNEDFSADAASIETSRQSILAGDDAFDMIQGHDLNMVGGMLQNLFYNAYKVPYLDFTKPWWPAATTESMTVAGQMYLMFNNISYRNLADVRIMFFNKELFTNNNIEFPYNMVYDGSWTMDAMLEIVEKGYVDTNGNGERDLTDQYGYVHGDTFYGYMEPFKLEPYKKDKDGNLYYELELERISTLAEKSYALMFGTGGFFNSKETYVVTREKTFAQGTSLFYYDKFEAAVTTYSNTDILYGVVPMPKLDERQDSYHGGGTDRPIAVPVTALPNLETVGLVTEALNIEGYKQVFPAYFETAMKSRYADQTDDAAMIDIVHENLIISFTYLVGDHKSAYNCLFADLFRDTTTPGTDVASWAARKESEQIARVETLQKFFEENRD